MRLPVLRETRMPAVLCAIGPVQHVIDHDPGVAAAVVEALESWAQRRFASGGEATFDVWSEAPPAPPRDTGIRL